jgi:hypothetical protein
MSDHKTVKGKDGNVVALVEDGLVEGVKLSFGIDSMFPYGVVQKHKKVDDKYVSIEFIPLFDSKYNVGAILDMIEDKYKVLTNEEIGTVDDFKYVKVNVEVI